MRIGRSPAAFIAAKWKATVKTQDVLCFGLGNKLARAITLQPPPFHGWGWLLSPLSRYPRFFFPYRAPLRAPRSPTLLTAMATFANVCAQVQR